MIAQKPVPGSASEAEKIVARMNKVLGRENPNCRCEALGFSCVKTFSARQAYLLQDYAATTARAVITSGDNIVDLFLCMVMKDVRMVVVALPRRMHAQFEHDYRRYAEHFMVPSLRINYKALVQVGRPVLHVVSNRASMDGMTADMLMQMRPDLVIAPKVLPDTFRKALEIA